MIEPCRARVGFGELPAGVAEIEPWLRITAELDGRVEEESGPRRQLLRLARRLIEKASGPPLV